MRRVGKLVAATALASTLSGCVAALLPIAAAGMLGKTEIDRVKAKEEMVAAGAIDLGPQMENEAIASIASAPATDKNADNIGQDNTNQNYTGQGGGVEIDLDEDSRKYLSRFFKRVGSVETSPFTTFTNYALTQSAKLEAGEGVSSAVLIPRVDVNKPKTMPCSGKPLAVMIDLDDAGNAGWSNADTLYYQNGLVEAVNQLRASQISVIWLSDAPEMAAERIGIILSEAGLSAENATDFLFLDRGGDDRKQERRWQAARNYCVVAVAGDKRSDFDELYDYLRDPDGAITLEHMFGKGWFMTPPPLVVASASQDETAQDKAAQKENEDE